MTAMFRIGSYWRLSTRPWCMASSDFDSDRLALLVLILGIPGFPPNLVSNAAQYRRPDTPIRVIARDDGDVVSVSVANDGDPIPTEVLATFFEPCAAATPATDTDHDRISGSVCSSFGRSCVRTEERGTTEATSGKVRQGQISNCGRSRKARAASAACAPSMSAQRRRPGQRSPPPDSMRSGWMILRPSISSSCTFRWRRLQQAQGLELSCPRRPWTFLPQAVRAKRSSIVRDARCATWPRSSPWRPDLTSVVRQRRTI